MNNIKKLIATTSLALGLFALPTLTDASTSHTVQSGESFWKIATQYGVSVTSLLEENNRTSSALNAGETIKIPNSISEADKELLAKLVHAEAKGEPYAGKVAVATVVLNRLDHPDYPNTIKDVIYAKSSKGYYAFSPVKDGAINQTPNDEARKAVKEALAFRGQGKGSLYFYNPETATSEWIFSREVTTTIGNHRFAK
ncbi:cell wall hydrolase [Bacillus spongiae]|uniref:Cell wall hydrolase n=1 Tax=Bacillus spongiae TaxID=2683610 RepID=A0ABU8HF83_9BACI